MPGLAAELAWKIPHRGIRAVRSSLRACCSRPPIGVLGPRGTAVAGRVNLELRSRRLSWAETRLDRRRGMSNEATACMLQGLVATYRRGRAWAAPPRAGRRRRSPRQSFLPCLRVLPAAGVAGAMSVILGSDNAAAWRPAGEGEANLRRTRICAAIRRHVWRWY